jgi:hypothetical protein
MIPDMRRYLSGSIAVLAVVKPIVEIDCPTVPYAALCAVKERG